jgi:tetratricopeptide (TPR) repeat protein
VWVELLLREADHLIKEGRYAEALKAAEKAVEGASGKDLRLEVRALRHEANALRMLGQGGSALARLGKILAIGGDSSRWREIERAGVEWEIADAYMSSVMTGMFLAEVPTEKLFVVLDAGEAYVRGIGRAEWRAGFLCERASLLARRGRLEEAIGVAEEGLSLKLRDGSGPGATRATHRWALGDLLYQVERYDDARAHFQAALDDPEAIANDHVAAQGGLAHCAFAAGDAALARMHAGEGVRLAEGMGDEALTAALEVFIWACRAAGDLAAAREAVERMLQGARRLGSTIRLYYALRNAADVALDEKDATRARTLIDEAEPHAEALDRQRGSTMFRDEIQRRRARLAELGPA